MQQVWVHSTVCLSVTHHYYSVLRSLRTTVLTAASAAIVFLQLLVLIWWSRPTCWRVRLLSRWLWSASTPLTTTACSTAWPTTTWTATAMWVTRCTSTPWTRSTGHINTTALKHERQVWKTDVNLNCENWTINLDNMHEPRVIHYTDEIQC